MNKAVEMLRNMAIWEYKNWYEQEAKKQLTKEQKDNIMRRISNLTLEAPIWDDRETDYQEQFPELKPYISPSVGKISGLQLVGVMEAIFEELIGKIPEVVDGNARAVSTNP